MIYSISYDLYKPGQNYEEVSKAIKSLGNWWHHLNSTWLVSTSKNAQQIWEIVQPHIDENDRILIIEIGKDYSGWLPEKAWDWIKKQIHVYSMHY